MRMTQEAAIVKIEQVPRKWARRAEPWPDFSKIGRAGGHLLVTGSIPSCPHAHFLCRGNCGYVARPQKVARGEGEICAVRSSLRSTGRLQKVPSLTLRVTILSLRF